VVPGCGCMAILPKGRTGPRTVGHVVGIGAL
jgi:hypothetical protein